MARTEQIGDATLILGDCREILPTLGAVDCIITDPPYGMAFHSNHRNVRHKPITNDKTDELLLWTCSIPVRHGAYVFCRWDNLAAIPRPKSLLTWVKNNWSMGDLEHEHARQTEVVAFYAGPEHKFPAGRPTDVIHAARTQNEFHPTEKPVALMQAMAGWTTGTILDPFMGSGTTGVACARLGRAFIGIEIHEPYFDIALRRIEAEYRQPRMFVEPPPKAKQEAML